MYDYIYVSTTASDLRANLVEKSKNGLHAVQEASAFNMYIYT